MNMRATYKMNIPEDIPTVNKSTHFLRTQFGRPLQAFP